MFNRTMYFSNTSSHWFSLSQNVHFRWPARKRGENVARKSQGWRSATNRPCGGNHPPQMASVLRYSTAQRFGRRYAPPVRSSREKDTENSHWNETGRYSVCSENHRSHRFLAENFSLSIGPFCASLGQHRRQEYRKRGPFLKKNFISYWSNYWSIDYLLWV